MNNICRLLTFTCQKLMWYIYPLTALAFKNLRNLRNLRERKNGGTLSSAFSFHYFYILHFTNAAFFRKVSFPACIFTKYIPVPQALPELSVPSWQFISVLLLLPEVKLRTIWRLIYCISILTFAG